MLMFELKEKKILKLFLVENICIYMIDWIGKGESLCIQLKFFFVLIVLEKKDYIVIVINFRLIYFKS